MEIGIVKHMMTLAAALAVFSLAAAPQAAKDKDKGKLDWHQFRGPNRDGHSPDTGLLKQWPQGGPPPVWKATGIGEGFSSVSILGDRIYTMGDIGGSCCLVAVNAADGKVVWAVKVGKDGHSTEYKGPRSTPATDGTLVYGLGQYGDLVCVEAKTGRERWRKNLESEGGKIHSGWGFAESPLLDGAMLVLTPGSSKGTVMALNKLTGAPAWYSAQLKDPAGYGSLVPIEVGGVRQYLVFTAATIAAVAAKNGQVVWKADRKGETAVIPTPVYADGLIFVTSGYNVGHNAFRLAAQGGQFRVQEAYNGKEMVNHHGGVVLVDGHVYGHSDRGGWKCIELKTGKEVWANNGVGKGAVVYADGHLVTRSEGGGGTLALVEATPTGYKEKGRFDQPERSGKQAWAHPVVFGGRMYIRDQDKLFCFDLKAK